MPDSICSIFIEDADTQTSTDAGVTTTIDSRNFRNGYIGIKNTQAVNTLQYKIDSYMNTDGTIIIAEQSYADIAPSAQVVFKIDDAPRAKYIITVKSKVGAAHSTYKVEYCLGL